MSTNPMMKALVERLSDAAWLSEQVGYGVRVQCLRIKPGTSITAGVRNEFGGHGWVRLLWPGGEGKARKHLHKATARGRDVREAVLDGGFLLQHGTVLSDPKLMGLLGPDAATETFAEQGVSILRYNPERRLVFADAHRTRVHRVTVRANPVSPALYRALSTHVPLPSLFDDATSPHHSIFAFVGDGDLSGAALGARRAEECAAQAGELFARLHASTPHIDPAVLADLDEQRTDACAQAVAHVELFDIMDPTLADRLRGVLATLEPQVEMFHSTQPVLCHGDASPDQVLFSTAGGMWLTDLDRLQWAPAAVDLGSYVASASEEQGAAFLEGYRSQAAGLERLDLSSITADQIRLATAMSHIARLAGPLRSADPQWRERTHRTLDRIEHLITTTTTGKEAAS